MTRHPIRASLLLAPVSCWSCGTVAVDLEVDVVLGDALRLTVRGLQPGQEVRLVGDDRSASTRLVALGRERQGERPLRPFRPVTAATARQVALDNDQVTSLSNGLGPTHPSGGQN